MITDHESDAAGVVAEVLDCRDMYSISGSLGKKLPSIEEEIFVLTLLWDMLRR